MQSDGAISHHEECQGLVACTAEGMRRWNLVATGLALMLLAGVLAKSGPEIDAIRWHRKNGDRR